MANFNLSASINGLRQYDFNAPLSDSYVVMGTLELPSQAATAPSGPGGGGIGTGSVPGPDLHSQVVVVVKLNSTTVYTGPAGAKGFKTGVNAVASDTISIILSSSLSIDQQPNAVKGSIQIYQGGD